MAAPRFATLDAYLDAAPAAGQDSLRRLHALLRKAAPDAQETIKWNTPFFVEPRFLFSFSAHKAHLGFVATPESLAPFRAELEPFEVTKMGIVKVPYTDPLPEALIRKIARHRVRAVRDRGDDGFW